MGLDMYAFSVAPGRIDTTKQVDVAMPSKGCNELHYWRKHPYLHGWMEKLYRAKGGEAEFNCKTVRLESADLDALESAVNCETLPRTTGFFFGNFPPDAESRADDLKFIADARAALSRGEAVFYDSWW
jgi:hypothetical protein